MSVERELIADVIKNTLADSLHEAEVAEAVRRGAAVYKYLHIASTGIEVAFHLAAQNYPGAALVLARHVAGEAAGSLAARFIVEQGGFAARLQLDATQTAQHRDIVAALMKGHVAEPWISIYNKEVFWAASHADAVAAKAMAAVDLAGSMTQAAAATAGRVTPRIYHRLSPFSVAQYAGSWADKTREGWGRLTFPGQGLYAGVWDAGEPKGFGRRDHPDGRYYLGEIKPAISSGAESQNVLGMSAAADGKRVFVGEHRFPFILFNDRDDPAYETDIVPNGYGVEISDRACTRGYWRGGQRDQAFELRESFYEKLAQEARAMFEQSEHSYLLLEEAAKKGVEAAQLRYEVAVKDARWRRLLDDVKERQGFYYFAFDRL